MPHHEWERATARERKGLMHTEQIQQIRFYSKLHFKYHFLLESFWWHFLKIDRPFSIPFELQELYQLIGKSVRRRQRRQRRRRKGVSVRMSERIFNRFGIYFVCSFYFHIATGPNLQFAITFVSIGFLWFIFFSCGIKLSGWFFFFFDSIYSLTKYIRIVCVDRSKH